LDRSIERELIPLAQTYGLAILPWSPLARGFLTGKYPRGASLPDDSRAARDMNVSGGIAARTKLQFSEAAYAVLDTVDALAAEKKSTSGQIALAWCMNQPGITSPIVGPRTMDHLKENLGAASIALTEQDRVRLDAVAQPEQAIAPYYTGGLIDFKPPAYRW